MRISLIAVLLALGVSLLAESTLAEQPLAWGSGRRPTSTAAKPVAKIAAPVAQSPQNSPTRMAAANQRPPQPTAEPQPRATAAPAASLSTAPRVGSRSAGTAVSRQVDRTIQPAQYEGEGYPVTEVPSASMVAEPMTGGCGCGGTGCESCTLGGCGDAIGCGDSVGCCDTVGCGDLVIRGCIPFTICVPPLREATLFAGVQGFKNPLDQGRDAGNFGFHEGVNLGGKMAWLPIEGMGYQVGFRATQNQLSGDSTAETDDSHSQSFITTGLFRRTCRGLQFGAVYDWLNDERQGDQDFGQVRGEISLVNPVGRELGFAFAMSGNDAVVDDITFQTADQFTMFYRVKGAKGGEMRGFVGGTDESETLLGGSFAVPLTNRWSLDGGFTYLIPGGGTQGSGADDEAWNLGMSLVWHYGGNSTRYFGSQYRPLFGVADNGSMITVAR